METRRLILVLGGILVVLVVVIGGLAVATLGDGGDGNGDNGGGGDDGDNGGVETPAAESTPLPERVEGELRLFGPDPITLDPACATDAGSAQYIVEIFSGLVSFDRDLKIIPDLAEEIPEPVQNPDGTVSYTFTIRRGVTFHDGSRQVTANDFKFSLERSLNPDTLSTVGTVYLDDIVGAEEFAAEEADEVVGIRVVDDFTLEITVDAPKAYFLAKLTYPTAYVVDQREVGDSTCFTNTEWTLRPNGSGPFKLDEWQLGQRIVLTPNEGFHLQPAPSLAQVTYFLAGGSALVMYENDEIDLTGIGVNDIERFRDPNEALSAEFSESSSLDTFYIGLNTTEPPFDDPKVRQAFAMAIDKELLAQVRLKGLVVPANGVLPPGMPGFSEGLEGLRFDPEGARALLDEAGGPGSLGRIEILSSGRGANVSPTVVAVIAMLEENLGVRVDPSQGGDPGLFFSDLREGDYQMSVVGWIADYVDPQNFLDIKFHSESGNNETGYSNPEVDDLLERARTEQDEATRLGLYQQAEEIIVQDAPWIPLFHQKTNALIKPNVQDYFIAPFVIPNLRYVSINQ